MSASCGHYVLRRRCELLRLVGQCHVELSAGNRIIGAENGRCVMSTRRDDALNSQSEKGSIRKSGGQSESSGKKTKDEADEHSKGWRNSSLNPPK